MRKIVGIIISLFLFFSMGYTQESESETNDSYSTADTITINNSVSGNIGQVNNSVTDWHDWFLFITESDGKISFIGSPSSDLNIKLSLYDTNGGTVIEDALLNGTGVNDTLIFNYLKAGTYFMRLAVDGGAGSYTLTNTHTPAAELNDSEPNNTYETSTSLTLNNSTAGHIGFYGNGTKDWYDWYKIESEDDGSIQFIGIPTTALDLKISLFDTNGGNVIKDAELNGAAGINDTLNMNYLAAGTYYLRITFNDGYGSYILKNTLIATPELNDAEPNNSYETAISLAIDNSTTGHIGYYGDGTTDWYDWYKITTTIDGDIIFVCDPTDELDIKLTLYSSNGSSVIKDADIFGGIGISDTLTNESLNAGTYYLRITFNSGYGSYSLLAYDGNTTTNVESIELSYVQIYPNPFKDKIFLKSDFGLRKAYICNLLGARILSYDIDDLKLFTIPTSSLAQGIYILSIEDNLGRRKTKRIIKP